MSITEEKLMAITNVPREVWITACRYENVELDLDLPPDQVFIHVTGVRGFDNGGFERALADYLLRAGSFSDGGEFEHVSGYTI